ncbi:MAG: hypothetical protein OQK49_05475, partial [Proteobacteria bacterium]|nr:hypothetical protein [Pseudomonadota bacterium]
MKFKIALFLVLTLILIQSNAQSITTNINGNSAEIYVSLPGGLAADFTISFDNVIGLSAQNLGLSAEVVNVNDLNLLDRLPSGLL